MLINGGHKAKLSQSKLPKMIEAKYAKIHNLISRGTFRAVLRTELPNGANMITARYVLLIKSNEDKEERYKARYIAGGHLDVMKDYLVHGAQTIQCVEVRTILIIARARGFRLCVLDVKLAYLQLDKPLIRKIFITKPAPEFELSPDECLELLKPLYGLVDSREQWHQTLDDHFQMDLEMTPTIIDPSLYCKFEGNQLVDFNDSYVDDLPRAGTEEWKTQAGETLERFETTGNEQPSFNFAGMHITQVEDMLHIDQDIYT